MEQQAQRRGELQAQLVERASRDPAFRRELLADPKAAIARETGLQMPAGVEVRVVEETPAAAYLVLPPSPLRAGQELSDQELEVVAGGFVDEEYRLWHGTPRLWQQLLCGWWAMLMRCVGRGRGQQLSDRELAAVAGGRTAAAPRHRPGHAASSPRRARTGTPAGRGAGGAVPSLDPFSWYRRTAAHKSTPPVLPREC